MEILPDSDIFLVHSVPIWRLYQKYPQKLWFLDSQCIVRCTVQKKKIMRRVSKLANYNNIFNIFNTYFLRFFTIQDQHQGLTLKKLITLGFFWIKSNRKTEAYSFKNPFTVFKIKKIVKLKKKPFWKLFKNSLGSNILVKT